MGKLILGSESKRYWNWQKISGSLHVLRRTSIPWSDCLALVWLSSFGLTVYLGQTTVRPQNEKFFLRHEKFAFYFATSCTFTFPTKERIFLKTPWLVIYVQQCRSLPSIIFDSNFPRLVLDLYQKILLSEQDFINGVIEGLIRTLKQQNRIKND